MNRGRGRFEPFGVAAERRAIVTNCASLRFRQAETFVAYWKLHANPDAANEDAERRAAAASAYASETLDGTVKIGRAHV